MGDREPNQDPQHRPRTDTTQEGNTVGGDQSGANLTKDYSVNITGPVNLGANAGNDSYMERLIASFFQEASNNETLNQTVDRLLKHTEQSERDARSLEQKLSDADREYAVDEALELKEEAAKNLYKYGSFESAQYIFAYLMAEMRTNFNELVVPHIKKSDLPTAEINQYTVEKVIEPALAKLQENPLNLTKDEVRGFLFLLAGKCHIAWD